MALDKTDLEMIERVIYKNGDDVAVSIARSFERMEERIDAAESRIYSRLSDLEDKIETSRQDLSDELGDSPCRCSGIDEGRPVIVCLNSPAPWRGCFRACAWRGDGAPTPNPLPEGRTSPRGLTLYALPDIRTFG